MLVKSIIMKAQTLFAGVLIHPLISCCDPNHRLMSEITIFLLLLKVICGMKKLHILKKIL